MKKAIAFLITTALLLSIGACDGQIDSILTNLNAGEIQTDSTTEMQVDMQSQNDDSDDFFWHDVPIAPENDFKYGSNGDGGVEILGYNGNALKVRIPDTIEGMPITRIGENAFHENSRIAYVYIPKSVTSIGNTAFFGCAGLTNITIPDGVTSIGDYAFSGCTGLTEIKIHDRVISIGNWAFIDCAGLTNITIPDSVISIGAGAFHNCMDLTIYGSSGSYAEKYTLEEGVEFVVSM
ncbi:MAG: leucine-rich repeat domain-containing protein [Oscillospiraceae bacterium]|nr:leucine-rich repeat domain-containing protein [Oscillospiraceae bacterium]